MSCESVGAGFIVLDQSGNGCVPKLIPTYHTTLCYLSFTGFKKTTRLYRKLTG